MYLLNIFLCSNSFSSVLFSKAQKLQLYTIERCEVLHSCVHRRCFSGFTRSRDGGTLQDTVELCSDGGKEGRHQRSGRRLPRQKEPSDRSGDHLPPPTASSTPRMASLTAFVPHLHLGLGRKFAAFASKTGVCAPFGNSQTAPRPVFTPRTGGG